MDPEARKVIELGYGGSERLTMNMGPQHPSAHGVFRAILTLEGETVVGVDAVIGYLHRCHEKLGESLTYTQYPSIASKTDYVAAMTSELAYVRAAEMVGKVEVPKRAEYLRVIVAELQRVASHCLWLGTWCLDMGGALGGGATVFLYCIREREWVLDLFEALVGARLLYGFHQVGGTRYDIPAGWAQKCRETITLVEKRLNEYEDMLESNAFFLARTQGVGGISRELAQTVGVSGPLIRGSGVSYDIRRPLPGAHGRVPRVDQHRPPGPRRPAGGAGLLAPRREIGGPGAYRQGRGLRSRGRAPRRSGLLPHLRRRRQALPHEVARGLVLKPLGAPPHPDRLPGRRRGRDHGLGGSGVR
jgi:hypothetical protein